MPEILHLPNLSASNAPFSHFFSKVFPSPIAPLDRHLHCGPSALRWHAASWLRRLPEVHGRHRADGAGGLPGDVERTRYHLVMGEWLANLVIRKTMGEPQKNCGFMGFDRVFPLVICYIATENGLRNDVSVPIHSMVIFYSYVKLPEGTPKQ